MIPPAAEAARYELTNGTRAQCAENATRVLRERERERDPAARSDIAKPAAFHAQSCSRRSTIDKHALCLPCRCDEQELHL